MNQRSIPKPKVTFDILFDEYSKQKAITRMRSPPHQERPASSPRVAIRFRGESSQRQYFTPDWAPTSSNPLHPIYDDNGGNVGTISAILPSWMGRTKEINTGSNLKTCTRSLGSTTNQAGSSG
jgi:hypothetical protein